MTWSRYVLPCDRQTETERQRDRETAREKQRQRQTDRKTDRQADRQRESPYERQDKIYDFSFGNFNDPYSHSDGDFA